MNNFSIAKTDPWSRFIIWWPFNNYRSIVPVTIFIKIFLANQPLKWKNRFTVPKVSGRSRVSGRSKVNGRSKVDGLVWYLLSEFSFNQALFELPCNSFSNFRSFISIWLLLISKTDPFNRLKVHTPFQQIHLEGRCSISTKIVNDSIRWGTRATRLGWYRTASHIWFGFFYISHGIFLSSNRHSNIINFFIINTWKPSPNTLHKCHHTETNCWKCWRSSDIRPVISRT